MTNIYQFQTDNQIYEEASLWVTRLDRGLSDEETNTLRRWLSQNPKHKHCLLEMATLWDRMDSLSVLSELFDPPVAQTQTQTTTKTKWSLKHTTWGIAASTLFAIVAFNLLTPVTPVQEIAQQPPAKDTTTNTLYETGVGANSTINLPDGTQLSLNTNTQVSVTYSEHERLLVLNKGELLVDVAHDKQRPLRVQVGDRVVEAVGTVFNVYLKDKLDFDVIVTEGKVHVKPVTHKTNTIADTIKEPGIIQELAQGEKLSARASKPVAVESIGAAIINDRLSWRDGNLVFRGETLQDALNEVSRYTPDRFQIIDQRISSMRIAGLYKAGDVDGLLSALKENFNITSVRTPEGVIELSLQK